MVVYMCVTAVDKTGGGLSLVVIYELVGGLLGDRFNARKVYHSPSPFPNVIIMVYKE